MHGFEGALAVVPAAPTSSPAFGVAVAMLPPAKASSAIV
jgi:hypothetical protein